jgi:hypothetical protein
MCPVCIAAAALIAGKVTSTGGVAALVVKKFRAPRIDAKGSAEQIAIQIKSNGEHS